MNPGDDGNIDQARPALACGSSATRYALGAAGALVGGWLGYLAVGALLRFAGLYILGLSGALAGMGCAFLSRRRSLALGIFCAVVGMGLSCYTEWRKFPFIKDASFGYFIAHLGDLRPRFWIMTALNAVFGYWFGVGRNSPRAAGGA